MLLDIEDLREDYRRGEFDLTNADPDPFLQFKTWFEEALAADLPEPNAMTLATSTPDGHPSARIVLLKGFDEDGFIFYSNYESSKGEQLAANPRAALVFVWLEIHRQVRVEGMVEKLPADQSAAYFRSRPRGSQIGAWASPQSRIIESREIIEEKVRELEEKYAGAEALPLPDYWGGYRVKPHRIEFWQGRSSRLHDRILYRREEGLEWTRERLAP